MLKSKVTMSASLSLYCRLCAEQKLDHELINLTSNLNIREEIMNKLSIFSSNLVDFSIKTLPETVCTYCIQTLNSSYEFVAKIKVSQLDLTLASSSIKAELEDSNDSVDCPSSEKESSLIDLPETEAKDENIEFKIAFDGYKVTYCKTYSKSVSWSTYPWACSHCDKQLKNLGNLRRHSKECHDVCFSIKCVDCTDDMFVDDFDSFVEHVRGHRKELNQFCQHCNMKLDPDTLSDHVAMHKMKPHCSACGEFFEDDFALHKHLSHYQKLKDDVSWASYDWGCSECSLKFTDQDSLRRHTKEVHRKCFAMQCLECPETVETFREFVHHAREHKPSLKYYCQYCNFNYSEANQIILHILKHLHNQCETCGESFISPSALKSHVDAYKEPKKSHKKKKITKHTVRKITEQDLTCNVCQRVMKNLANLKVHKLLHTDRQKDYVCDRCGKAFFTKDAFSTHRILHDDPVPLVCQICKKGFLTMTKLKKHVRTHSSERNFECDTCHKSFRLKKQLRNHMACHSDVMRYACQYCDKSFRHNSVFKIHLRLHTGARPYVCHVCSKDFANWSNCNKHMVRKHGATLAKNVFTPQGKVPINPKTGKPKHHDPELVKDFSEQILRKRERKKKPLRPRKHT